MMPSVAQLELGRERPSNVPPNAGWFFHSEEWLFCERDAHGELHGSVRTYREDGTPWLEYEYRHGKRHGPFRRYHASGQVAQEGRYFDDLLDGLVSFRSDGENTSSIRECCIPASTRVMRQEHRRGQLLAETYENERGQVLEEPAIGAPGAKGWPEPLCEREHQVFSFAFDFWPAREPLSSTLELAKMSVEQPVLAVRQAMRRSAQRLLVLRRELMRHGMSSDSADVSPLLTEPELPLRRFAFETDGDVGKLTVHVDETIAPSQSPRELWVRMRLEWTALCWLSWGVGLDELALPERVEPRPELHAALLMASQRQSVLTGHDLKPSSAQHFHGLDETLLPASALSLIADHYREIRAVLLFLVDVECQSPWQDDLGRTPSAPEL